ncbi:MULTISPECIES: GGDEF domain-containing protein [unclassified Bacillus (in: firmicutes)]|uniref:GGDEF domain-containing protein n=1 Tax=unclassified Bacillus (in: firmicutes) TaxID=185979 RepID=UPI000BEF8409|nr:MULTISPECIES: GGDEF domain-containing protein [unclassified Bacillus (in: firmicutes)]PEJ53113.1 hypothetical protein CN692_21610 [Bacillus sp. AFS002410]PEL13716.1 hypothetical protein CN601_03110 [Bacillus sp. AFS017336]
MLDIDFFKKLNDHYVHQRGDSVLKLVATAIQDSIYRSEDNVARYGGEEFAIILPNTDYDGAVIVANRIMDSVRKLKIEHVKSEKGFVSISMGLITTTPKHFFKHEKMIDETDKLLYESKQNGRDQLTSSLKEEF